MNILKKLVKKQLNIFRSEKQKMDLCDIGFFKIRMFGALFERIVRT